MGQDRNRASGGGGGGVVVIVKELEDFLSGKRKQCTCMTSASQSMSSH